MVGEERHRVSGGRSLECRSPFQLMAVLWFVQAQNIWSNMIRNIGKSVLLFKSRVCLECDDIASWRDTRHKHPANTSQRLVWGIVTDSIASAMKICIILHKISTKTVYQEKSQVKMKIGRSKNLRSKKSIFFDLKNFHFHTIFNDFF